MFCLCVSSFSYIYALNIALTFLFCVLLQGISKCQRP